MKFFIDTANVDEIRKSHELGLLDAALMGADIATIPFKVMEQLIKHPLTDIGLKNFLSDWEKMG